MLFLWDFKPLRLFHFFSVMKIILPIFLIILSFGLLAQEGVSYQYPDDAGLIDVTKSPYFADNMGIEDATDAINMALMSKPSQNRIIYLPAGTYLVSNTLSWPLGNSEGGREKRTILHGEGMDVTIIKLIDSAVGFQNPESKKPVIFTGTAPAQRFRNSIRNLTVNTGSNNSGVSAIKFNCSNQGAMDNVKIISEDGNGVVGLDLEFTNEIGPGFISNIIVEGFDIGIHHGRSINSMTFENITLKNQNVTGFLNESNVSNIRNIRSENQVVAIMSNKPQACMAILDAHLNGGGNMSAIINNGTLYCRNINTEGYSLAIENNAGNKVNFPDGHIKEFSSDGVLKGFNDSPLTMLKLPVKDIPIPAWASLEEWVSPLDFGALGDGEQDDTEAIQKAIDSGSSTVYLPGGYKFKISDTLKIRGNVTRFIGCEGRIEGTAVIAFVDAASPEVIFERVDGSYTELSFLHATSRTVVISNILDIPVTSIGSGDLFINDLVSSPHRYLNKDQSIWARQLDIETQGEINVTIDGAKFWMLGFKSESGNIKFNAINGAKMEIIGVHNYAGGELKTNPYFQSINSSISIAAYRETHFENSPYDIYVREIRNLDTADLFRRDIFGPVLGKGKAMGLYAGYQLDREKPDAPENVSAIKTSIVQNRIAWDDSEDLNIDYYSVYFTSVPEGRKFTLTSYLKEPYFDHKFDLPVNYYYTVTSVDTLGVESEYSLEVLAIEEDNEAPQPPKDLKVLATNDSHILLEWSANIEEDFDSYNIWRSNKTTSEFELIAEEYLERSYIDSTVEIGVTYLYAISALDTSENESERSNTQTITVPQLLGFKQNSIEILIFPNPIMKSSDSELNLYHLKSGSEVSIYDLSGNVVFKEKSKGEKFKVDLGLLPVGVLTIKIEAGQDISVQKVIVLE